MSEEPDQRQTCPRRMSEMGPWSREEGQDTWTTGHGVVGQDTVGLSCSFCGSLHPDRFMELVRKGWTVGPTDKSYKAYLGRPVSDEERAQHKARWLDGFTPEETRQVAEEREETPEQYRAQLEAVYEQQIAPGHQSGTEAKFYYQHLSPEQETEFIELYNSRRMNVGAPGHFYRLPFSCGRDA